MKITSLPIVAFLAVLTASILIPVSVAKLCTALVIAGFAALLVSDYRDSAATARTIR
jgi:hypothetical protein